MAYYKLSNPTVSPSNENPSKKKIEKWEMGELKKARRTQTILLSRQISDNVDLVVHRLNGVEKCKEN